ncbi:MAG: phosphohistidine phosphatase SixA [Gaiellaceae bacterium]
MDLYLVRHAIAEPRDPAGRADDARRELTSDGILRLRAAATGLGRLGVEVELLLSSPYPRARQTAEILSKELGWPAPTLLDLLAPPASATAFLDALRGRQEGSLAVVGHQPDLSELASLLLAGDGGLVRIELRKAGVVCLSAPAGLAPGSAVLRWSASPRMLRRLAG